MKLGFSDPFGDGGSQWPSGEEKIDHCPRRRQGFYSPTKVGEFNKKAFEEITVVQTSVTTGALLVEFKSIRLENRQALAGG